jgi:hypothetical protein
LLVGTMPLIPPSMGDEPAPGPAPLLTPPRILASSVEYAWGRFGVGMNPGMGPEGMPLGWPWNCMPPEALGMCDDGPWPGFGTMPGGSPDCMLLLPMLCCGPLLDRLPILRATCCKRSSSVERSMYSACKSNPNLVSPKQKTLYKAQEDRPCFWRSGRAVVQAS